MRKPARSKGVPGGSDTTIEYEDEGPLEFAVQDDILADNSGHFLVKLNVRLF